MKLAEALLLRSDIQKKLASIQQRIQQNVLVQEGDEPSENPQDLINEALELNKTLYNLIKRIHLTNAHGENLINLLSRRDLLIAQHQVLQQALDHAQRDSERYSMREIKWLKTIPIAKIQKQADDISATLRQLNVDIQSTNWQIDLML